MKVYAAEKNYDGGGSYETEIISLHLNRENAESVAFDAFQVEYDQHQADKLKYGDSYRFNPEITFFGQGGGQIGLRSWTVTEYEVKD